ncbi:uncharacterized protein LOC143367869 [Andrena cerasifolii]|uniref:uncharacterized protein LOC143367869 n=1 Tax=Andrena cerasifolii TaxID=2819439 RepID=UPI004037B1C1
MLSINMRAFKSLLLVAVLFFNGIECLPVADDTSIAESTTTKPAELSSENDHYDQRQNGTDNYRIHVDGVVLAFAPVEALLLAGANGIDKPSLIPIPEPSKPTPDKPPAEPRPSPASKPSNRSGINLANLLVPFLRRLRQE